MSESTASIYDRSSDNWERQSQTLLSDFTARPFLIDWCQPLAGLKVLDLGCGEGYVARALLRAGAASLDGVDVSEAMIERARLQEAREPLGARFAVGSATELPKVVASYDLVVAVFLFNYLTVEEMRRVMSYARRALLPGGRFIFSVPHPVYAFMRENSPPFGFSREGRGYFSGRNATFEGQLWRRDGLSVPVRCVHKTLEDYFDALAAAGFSQMPQIKELRVLPEHQRLDPEFFDPIADYPLHLAFRLTTEG